MGEKHGTYLGSISAEANKHDALCELNVMEQVKNVCQTTAVRDAWARGQSLAVHGWIYGVDNGLLRDLEASVDGAGTALPVLAAALARLRDRARPA